MKCAKCGAPDQGSGRFCGVCGAAVSLTEPARSSEPGGVGEPASMIGREIAGRYRMLAKLGEGGMGAVYRAEQISLKRTVAVKLLRPDVLGNQLVLRRFNAEAEAVAKLSHPNTVNIYDFGQDSDGTLFIAMEYIEGRSLRSVVHREAPLAPRRALAIAQQIAASLADAHAHAIVHRDLKPDNVMLMDRGRERDVARVLDFGIAKLRDDNRATQMQMTQQGDMLGTPQYMAPEQIRAEAIDGPTDIYALGCLMYEMVTARLPHEAPTVLAMLSKHLLEQPPAPSARRPDLNLPGALDALIMAAMNKDPAARPQTMEIVGERIAEILAVLPRDASGALPRVRSATGAPAAIETPPAHSAALSQPMATPAPAMMTPAPAMMTPAPAMTPPAPGMMMGPPPAVAVPYAPRAQPVPVAAPPRRRAVLAIVLAGVAVTFALAAALALRKANHARHDEPAHAHDDDDDHDAAPPDAPPPPAPPTNDPWQSGSAAPPVNDPWSTHAGASADVAGDKLAVGEGLQLIAPPGFAVKRIGTATYLTQRDITIAAAPLAIGSNDPAELARDFARRFGLTFDRKQTLSLGGQDRPLLLFHGPVNGVAMRQAVVPLIGPSYRMAVVFQVSTRRLQRDTAANQLMVETFNQRVLVP